MFSGQELVRFVDQARWVAVNAYEGELLSERRGSQQMRSPGALRL